MSTVNRAVYHNNFYYIMIRNFIKLSTSAIGTIITLLLIVTISHTEEGKVYTVFFYTTAVPGQSGMNNFRKEEISIVDSGETCILYFSVDYISSCCCSFLKNNGLFNF
jgi:hypothetical protein